MWEVPLRLAVNDCMGQLAFDRQRDSHAAADAERRETLVRVALFAFRAAGW
jgi:hypothetical protein